VRPTLVAIGATDLAVARGDGPLRGRPGPPVRRAWSSRFGPGVSEARWASGSRGKRVVGNINIASADDPLAQAGALEPRAGRRVLGLVNMDGCFADAFTIPVANLALVPEGVGDDAAVFAEPLAAAVHASRIVHLEGKGFVTVIGDTLSALLCAQVMEPAEQLRAPAGAPARAVRARREVGGAPPAHRRGGPARRPGRRHRLQRGEPATSRSRSDGAPAREDRAQDRAHPAADRPSARTAIAGDRPPARSSATRSRSTAPAAGRSPTRWGCSPPARSRSRA
jgi:hypothetical protein